MTQRTMTGHLQRVGIAALLSLLPSLAWAQTTGTGAATTTTIDPGLVVKRGNDVLKSVEIQYLGVKDCSEDVKFTFSVQYTTLVPVVEAWLGNAGVDCTQQTNRQPTIVGSLQRPCVLLQSLPGNTSKPTIEIDGQKLLSFSKLQSSSQPPQEQPRADQDGGAGDADGDDAGTATPSGPFACDRINAVKYTVYIIPMSTATTNTLSPMPISAGYSTLKASFSVFTIPPDAPTSVRPLSGETRIGVGYTRAMGTSMLTRYRAYFDTNGCDATSLKEGDDFSMTSTPPPGVVPSSTTQGESIYLSGGSVDVGASAAAGVVTIDVAGNESKLSEVTCVRRVETTGFWDACQQDPSMRCQKDFESCTLSPTSRGSALGAAFFALALAALLRRSRRVDRRASDDRKDA